MSPMSLSDVLVYGLIYGRVLHDLPDPGHLIPGKNGGNNDLKIFVNCPLIKMLVQRFTYVLPLLLP